jgi:hypothetical protein
MSTIPVSGGEWRGTMDTTRGGVFSGAMVLAGLSATLLSALAVIGIRALTLPPPHTAPIFVRTTSGDVSVPDAAASAPSPSVSPTHLPSAAHATHLASPHRRASVTSRAAGVTTTRHSSAPAATAQSQPTAAPAAVVAPAPAPAPASPSSPASSTPATNGNGQHNGAANGNGGNGGNGNGGGHGHGH